MDTIKKAFKIFAIITAVIGAVAAAYLIVKIALQKVRACGFSTADDYMSFEADDADFVSEPETIVTHDEEEDDTDPFIEPDVSMA